MLNAIGTPLILCDFAEYDRSLVEELIDDAILRRLLQVLEGVLKDY